MIFSPALFAAIFALAIGAAAIWSNPRRLLNRTLLSLSLHIGLWLVCLHPSAGGGANVLSARLAAILMAALVPHVWWVKETIMQPELSWRERLKRGQLWFGAAVLLSAWASSGFFQTYSPGLPPLVSGQLFFLAGVGIASALFVILTLQEVNARKGIRQLEGQVLLLGAGAMATVAILCGIIESWLGQRAFLENMPLAVIAIHAITTWALTSVQVLDAKHLAAAVFERVTLVTIIAVFTWSVQEMARQLVYPALAYLLSLAVGLWFAAEVYPWIRVLFRRGSRSSQLRRTISEVMGKELQPEALEDAFVQALKEGTRADRVVILMSSQSRLAGGGLEFPIDAPVMKALHALRWVTPEGLERIRQVPEQAALKTLMAENGFGLIIANRGSSLSFAVALGVPETQQPYTRPEVLRLLDLSAAMEISLSRARYLRQAQQAEQLAVVGLLGAGIAHEIRNPLVTIKTFVQLLPTHYDDPAFRDKFFHLIGDEVGRIDRLTEQLLDLAAPKVITPRAVDIHPIIQNCIDLIASKAEDKGIKLVSDFKAAPDSVHTDPNAIKQVILNLCFNAIQALEQHNGDRWIKLETVNLVDVVEVSISDSGPGIAPEIWGRLFQPFQSTKSSGFGLGLAICKDILFSLRSNVAADPPIAGRGAIFRITLPCQPPIT